MEIEERDVSCLNDAKVKVEEAKKQNSDGNGKVDLIGLSKSIAKKSEIYKNNKIVEKNADNL